MPFPVAGWDLDSFPRGTGRQLPIGAAGLPPGTLLAAVGTLLPIPCPRFLPRMLPGPPCRTSNSFPCPNARPAARVGSRLGDRGLSMHEAFSAQGFGTSGVWDGKVGTGRDSTAFRQAPGTGDSSAWQRAWRPCRVIGQFWQPKGEI